MSRIMYCSRKHRLNKFHRYLDPQNENFSYTIIFQYDTISGKTNLLAEMEKKKNLLSLDLVNIRLGLVPIASQLAACWN